MDTLKNNDSEFKQYHSFVMARYDYTMIEMRILLSLLYLSDRYIEQGKTKDLIGEIYDGAYGQKIVCFPINVLLGNEFKDGEPSKNYQAASEALKSFSKKPISFFVDYDQWRDMMPFIITEKYRGEGCLTAVIAPQVWSFLKNVAGRFVTLDIKDMMDMKSKYTIRMHQIVEGLLRPVTFKTSTLKEMFMLENKYKNNAHFFEKVLDVAKKELKEHHLTTFEYKKECKGERRIGKPSVTHVTLIPVNDDIMDRRTVRRIANSKGLSQVLSEDELTLLMKIGFRPEEIKANIEDIYTFARYYDFCGEMNTLDEKSRDKENPKGWIINEIRQKNKLLEDISLIKK